MWAQAWDSIFDLLAPYPNTEKTNLTEILIDKGYTPYGLFKVSK
jgi:hypothetical protein